MKKIALCLATFCLLSVLLTACGSEEPKNTEKSQQKEKMQAADERNNK